MKKLSSIALTITIAISGVFATTTASNAASCSFTAYAPYENPVSGRTWIEAHTILNCSASTSGWVKANLYRNVTLAPDKLLDTATDSTQNSSYNFNAYASACDSPNATKGYYTTGLASTGATGRSATVDLICH